MTTPPGYTGPEKADYIAYGDLVTQDYFDEVKKGKKKSINRGTTSLANQAPSRYRSRESREGIRLQGDGTGYPSTPTAS